MSENKKIKIENVDIFIISKNNEDYISLADMARSQLEDVIIIKWLRQKKYH